MLTIDKKLVRNLLELQFPAWKDLSIQPILPGGWDNRCFKLGSDMLIRMPSSEEYACQVQKEQEWLPFLAPHLHLRIPTPLSMGKPSKEYPFHWSIYPWIEGEPVLPHTIVDLSLLAKDLAEFLKSLHLIDASDGPKPGLHNFYRGGNLSVYDTETQKALALLKNKIDTEKALSIWQEASQSTWRRPDVWVHGDMSRGNLLVRKGKLHAVIDFGMLCIGDPACDLVIAWTLFKNESRKIFYETLALDLNTWRRAKGWALWKSAIIIAGLTETNALEHTYAWNTIYEIVSCDLWQ